VRNLAQVRRGDRVVVTYIEVLAVEMAPPGGAAPPEVGAGRGPSVGCQIDNAKGERL
jgi:hypothetical protein